MAVRQTMADLIGELRRVIGDSAGAGAVFADDDLQRFLDAHQAETSDLILIPFATREAGALVKKVWRARRGFWERDAQFYDHGFNSLAPQAASDYLNGRFVFAASQTRVTASGFVYDLHAAAADAFEAWAAKEKLSFDFSADGQSYKESQKAQTLLQLAKEFRAKSTFAVGTSAYASGDWR